MPGFTKLFSSIVTSTIWCENHQTRIVWITMLALADQRGFVDGTVPGLAGIARVTVDECRSAIAALESPDADSRTQEHEGRRIKKCDGGWFLLNHAKYREKLSQDERRAYKAAKQSEYRKRGQAVDTGGQNVDNVDTGGHKQKQSTEAEAKGGTLRSAIAEPKNGIRQVWQIKRDLETLRESLKTLRVDAGQTFDGRVWIGSVTPDVKAEILTMKQRIKDWEKEMRHAPP